MKISATQRLCASNKRRIYRAENRENSRREMKRKHIAQSRGVAEKREDYGREMS